jgi:cobalt-zinc-cadmium efflux system membrane fusion protein
MWPQSKGWLFRWQDHHSFRLRPLLPIALLILGSSLAACFAPPPENVQGGHDEPQASEEHAAETHQSGIVELTAEAIAHANIRTAIAGERLMAPELQTTGQVDFDQTKRLHVSPRIAGRLLRVQAILGQKIRAGQKLAELDSIELGRAKAEYLEHRAMQELAQASLERVQKLFEHGINAEQVVQEAVAARQAATAALRSSEEILHLYGLDQKQVDALQYDDPSASVYPLLAPMSGTIVELHATMGELAKPEDNLFTLADLSRVWIWIDISQADLAKVHLEDRAQARVDAFPNDVFEGKVSFLSALVDAETRTVRARLEMANPEGKLRPGMFVEVDLVDPHSAEGQGSLVSSLVVPEEAVVRDGDTFAVFIAKGEGHFERREIVPGRKSEGFVEILDGLEVGSAVVVEGAFLLKSALAKESLGGGHSH